PRLTTVAGLEGLVARITRYASDVYNPLSQPQPIRDYGSMANYRVAVINGDVDLGPGSGYGILLVRGAVRVVGHFNWDGLILVIGQCALSWTKGTAGINSGGIFIAHSQAADRAQMTPPGHIAADQRPPATRSGP